MWRQRGRILMCTLQVTESVQLVGFTAAHNWLSRWRVTQSGTWR